VDANYVLQNGIGQVEPTIIVLGSTSSTNCTNVRMMDQPLVEVKSNQVCPAVIPRTTYLIGSPVPGQANICGATSYTYEFQQYSACGGGPTGFPFEVNTSGSTPYLVLSQAFPSPTYPMTGIGYWRVRIKPNFSYGSGTYGPYQMVSINNTGMSSSMLQEDEFEIAEKSNQNPIQAGLYPNPNDGTEMQLIIHTPSEKAVQIRILDAVGRETERRVVLVDQVLQYPFVFNNTLESGVYFVEIGFDDQIITQKFVVSH
jgi:hypothetical protein